MIAVTVNAAATAEPAQRVCEAVVSLHKLCTHHFYMYIKPSVSEMLDLPLRCHSAKQPCTEVQTSTTSMAMSRTAPLQDFFSFSLVESRGQINACWLQNLNWQDFCCCMTIKISNVLNLLDTHPTFSSQSQAIWNWWQSFQGFPRDWILTNVKITRLNLTAVNSFYMHMRNSWSKYSPNSATVSSIPTTFLQKQRNWHSGLDHLTMETCPWQASITSFREESRKYGIK